jgi:hypothetical protein
MDFFGVGGGGGMGSMRTRHHPMIQKMLQKVVFYKTNLTLKIILNKTLMKHIQNNQKYIKKSIPGSGF